MNENSFFTIKFTDFQVILEILDNTAPNAIPEKGTFRVIDNWPVTFERNLMAGTVRIYPCRNLPVIEAGVQMRFDARAAMVRRMVGGLADVITEMVA